MKKTIVALGLLLTMVITRAYANEIKVSPEVLKSFKSEFSTARDVRWSEGQNYYKAAFLFNGQNVFAYYKTDGELISIARYISSVQLPIQLLSDFKNDYSHFWISGLFEATKNDSTYYYMTLENGSTVLKLESGNGSAWKTYEKKTKES